MAISRLIIGENSEQFRLGERIQFEEHGFSLRGFSQQTVLPPPPPQGILLQHRTTGEQIRVYPPLELWKHSQQIAILRNQWCEIQIVQLTSLFPETLPLINEQYVLPDTFKQHIQQQKLAVWDLSTLKAWIRSYTGGTILQESFFYIQPNSVTLKFLLTHFAENQPYLIYLLCNQSLSIINGVVCTPLISMNPSQFEQLCDRMAQTLIWRTHSSLTSKHQTSQVENIIPLRVQGKDRDDLRRELQSLPQWWYIESENYFLKSNITASSRRKWSEMLENLERLQKKLRTLLPPVEKSLPPAVITVFADRTQYLQYVPIQAHWTEGVWLPTREELVVTPYTQRQEIDWNRIQQLLFHESTHQYLFYASKAGNIPIWFDEGHAMIFEVADFSVSSPSGYFPIHPIYYSILQRVTKKSIDLKEWQTFLTMSPKEFYNLEQRIEHYALAWGLVFFLRKGIRFLSMGKDYHSMFLLWEKINQRLSLQELQQFILASFGDEKFLQNFLTFWRQKSLIKKAERETLE